MSKVFKEEENSMKIHGALVCDRLEFVEAPRGTVVAYENRAALKTDVAGYFGRELELTPDDREIHIKRKFEVEPIPEEHRSDVNELLKKNGYMGPFRYTY